MKHFYFILLLFVFCFFSCGKSLQDKAIKAASDGRVDKEEVCALMDDMQRDENLSGSAVFYTNGKADTGKMADYLVNLYHDLDIKVSNVWRPAAPAIAGKLNFAVNLYIENSASIDGYVNGNTRFKDAIYSMLGAFKNSLPGTINLNYLNKKVAYHVGNADESSLRSFIANLTPAEFVLKGGDRTSSDMTDLIHLVLDRTDAGNLSILVSDFVFSPGRNADAHSYLVNQSIGIRDELAQKIKTFPLAIEVMQMHSEFDGRYYDLHDHPSKFHGERPYYIWLIGSADQLNAVRKNGILEEIKGGVDHKLLFMTRRQPAAVVFKVLQSGKQGDFTLNDATSGELTDAAPAEGTAAHFEFEVAANYGNDLLDRDFFDDTANYIHDPNYLVSVSRIADTADITTKGYTHKIHFTTNKLRAQLIELDSRFIIPAWVGAYSSGNDENLPAHSDEQAKTFGFSYLVQGLYDAFYGAPNNNLVNRIQINIK